MHIYNLINTYLLQFFLYQYILEIYVKKNKACMRKTRRNGTGNEELEIRDNRSSTCKRKHRFDLKMCKYLKGKESED